MPYDSNFQSISDDECKAIFEHLAPEYTVVLKEKDEVEYRTFYLDDYQVGQINDMGRGHRVILANAGAGKSVLLLSKAFKYASMYKDSNIWSNDVGEKFQAEYDKQNTTIENLMKKGVAGASVGLKSAGRIGVAIDVISNVVDNITPTERNRKFEKNKDEKNAYMDWAKKVKDIECSIL